MTTTLYLIRHGESDGNNKQIFQGHTDADLSPKGHAQLTQLEKRFAGVALDAVYSSPLRRAYQTAQAVNHAHGLPIVAEPGLIEINGGLLEGLRVDEVLVRYPEMVESWVMQPHLYCAPGGDSMREVYDRMVKTVGRIVEENEGKTVAVVSHGCALRNYFCHALGLPYEALLEVPWLDNTGVTCVEYDQDNKPHMQYHNDVTHLGDELSALEHDDGWQLVYQAK